MAITLQKVFAGITDYVAKHESNYTIIENEINNLLLALGGSSGSSLAVPDGLREIFDRDGVIGINSFRFSEGAVVTSGILQIPPGSAFLGTNFSKSTVTQNVDLTGLNTGVPIFLNISSDGTASASNSSTATSIYSFIWDGASTISARTLLVDILFDGDDYKDQLDSANLGLTFNSVAERLEEIESRLGILGMFYGQDPSTTSGLTFGFFGGKVRNDNVVVDTSDGTLVLQGSNTNFIELTPSTGAVTSNTSGFTPLRIPLFIVTTNATSITNVDDRRTWATVGGGGGGGHAQNTDIGTDSSTFDLLLGQSSGSSNASLGVDRGTDPRVSVRWNETTDQWEFTNDGVNFSPIGGLDLGSQELSKFVAIEDPPQVLEVLNQSTGSSYTFVDLTNQPEILSGAPNGVAGLCLRVQFWDDAPNSNTNIKLREPVNPLTSPPIAYTKWAELTGSPQEQNPSLIIIEGEGFDAGNNVFQGFEYLITASGVGTANARIFLTGFFAKVTGVGTQDINFIPSPITVASATTVDSNLTGFVNRGLVHKFRSEELTGNPTGGYNVSFYSEDTFTNLLYQVTNIDPATPFEDFLPFWVEDLDLTKELHVRIENTDGSFSGNYQLTIDVEQFA